MNIYEPLVLFDNIETTLYKLLPAYEARAKILVGGGAL
jgi:hypothetical protein